ncbi:MAG: alcohol dehydrogenase catalytic domain-containing protein [Verrucomicrobia bacterium]|nr:alcohol dehydrogenase catalytic domain-containing protein [Verrucomicrobiota bacterium]
MILPTMMQAVVYRGVNNLQVEQVPVPKIGRAEVLVRVAVCGVCPTDIKKIQYGTLPEPRIFGHETSGRIVKVGSSVTGWREGQRVGLHHHVPCLKCHACKHRAYAQCAIYKQTGITAGFEPAGGGYAEYVRVMKHCLPGLVAIPQRGTFLEGAMLEPVNTVMKAVHRLDLQRGDHVLVAGQGPIGLIFTRLLQMQGMKVHATDLLEWRRGKAKRMGAATTHDPRSSEFEGTIRELTRGRGLDAAVIAVESDDAVRQAQQLLRGGGQVCLFAHTRRGVLSAFDFSIPCVDEKQLLGSYSTDITLQNQVAKLVFTRALDVRELITHRFPLEKTLEAVNLAANPSSEALKVMVTQADAEAEKTRTI